MTQTMELSEQKKRIHPHKFTLWVALGSIIMMFMGLTSAYIVKRNQANWQGFDLPIIFSYSTGVIVLSSITMHLAVTNFRNRKILAYRSLMIVTALLGIAFIAMQIQGFGFLTDKGIKLLGQGSNVSGSFLAVIATLHIVHVLGGIVTLAVILLKALSRKTRSYNVVPVEVAATYWHFVDFLWIYLFIFLTLVS